MLQPEPNTGGPAFASANGLRLCYESFGEPDDPLVVLIMGLAAQMIVWDDDFCRQLAARRRRVIRFDNRDIGLSTRLEWLPTPAMAGAFFWSMVGQRPQAPYDLADMAQDTLGLCDALGIRRFHVVGASMGGAVAQELAIHFPDRLGSLTTIMASSGNPRLPPPTPAAMGLLLRRPPLDRERYVRDYVARWKVLSNDRFPFDEAGVRRQGERAFARGIYPAGVARQMLAVMASGNRMKALRGVSVPAAVIHGSMDPLVPVAAAHELARAIPEAELTVIDGMGHRLPVAVWPQIFDAIDRAIARADGAPL